MTRPMHYCLAVGNLVTALVITVLLVLLLCLPILSMRTEETFMDELSLAEKCWRSKGNVLKHTVRIQKKRKKKCQRNQEVGLTDAHGGWTCAMYDYSNRFPGVFSD